MTKPASTFVAIALTAAAFSLTALGIPSAAKADICRSGLTAGQYPSYAACKKAYAKVNAKARARERVKARHKMRKLIEANRKSGGRLSRFQIRRKPMLHRTNRPRFRQFRGAPRFSAPRFRHSMPRFHRMPHSTRGFGMRFGRR